MIPSPVNLSTVPSKRVTVSARIEKKRCMILRHSSGSSCSARSIEPLTSANRTVTCLRSASSLMASFTKGKGYLWPSVASDSCLSRLVSNPDALPKHRDRLDQLRADTAGFVADLVMREAQRRHPSHHVRPVTTGVPKLRRRRAVIAKAIRLHHQPEIRPEEVDLELVDALFGEWDRELRRLDDAAEIDLQIGV